MVKNVKGGVVEFCVEKEGVIYVGVGKVSFVELDFVVNIKVFIDVVIKVKFFGVKGIYI